MYNNTNIFKQLKCIKIVVDRARQVREPPAEGFGEAEASVAAAENAEKRTEKAPATEPHKVLYALLC